MCKKPSEVDALSIEQLKYNEDGLIPVITQDATTLGVLMMAWMDATSIQMTLDKGEAIYWSRSRQSYWHKGATSGNIQLLKSLHYDCDADALLMLVYPAGPACHTGKTSCFYRNF